ncbi:MAG: VWA domain-containing protein [Clostridia bacterium]|nr:VWA domain-containing protein [Clostridia bacterium]
MAVNSPAFDNPFARGAATLAAQPREIHAPKADIILAIDACASMRPLWQQLKKDAPSITTMLDTAGARAGLTAADIRLRIVTFRDMYMHEAAFACSPFCCFPHDAPQLTDFIASVRPSGEGGPCTSGLEALLIALHSPWRREDGMRHRVAIITDSAAYQPDEPLRKFDLRYSSILGEFLPETQQDVPYQLEDLRRLWRDGIGTIDNWNSRILLYTISAAPWTQMVPWPRITPRQMFAEKIRRLQTQELFNDILSTL